jgi:hypothetical protein
MKVGGYGSGLLYVVCMGVGIHFGGGWRGGGCVFEW